MARIWPYLKSEQVDVAFSIADQDKGGEINWEEFQGFLRCIMYLNKRRHIINDLQESFSSEGLSDDDFHIACHVLGLDIDDLEATSHYCTELQRNLELGEVVVEERLTVGQFVVWAVRFECMLAHEDRQREKWMARELNRRAGKFGDVFFEDVADILAKGHHNFDDAEVSQQPKPFIAPAFLTP